MLTSEQKADLEALAAMPDDQINTRSIPEQPDWNGARRGLFFRPVKKQLALRLDGDLGG
jgi:uncharacterized protein (DUF4415 family)